MLAPRRGHLLGRPTLVAAPLLVLVGVFVGHAAMFGAWIVDDAGISLAYARNFADGAGLVAQPGASPVEAFSNPAWVFVLAGLYGLGVIGRSELLGLPDHVLVTKLLAVVAHAIVMWCLLLMIARLVRARTGAPARPGTICAIWVATGLVLTLQPSYVIWMVSGLENPLLAVVVAALAAVAIRSIERPTPRTSVAIGLLASAAAVTRPDGIIYVAVLAVPAALAENRTIRDRWRSMWPGLVAAGSICGGSLLARRIYFGAWLPNTAVAKRQDFPVPDDLARLADVGGSFGPWLLALGTIGALFALHRMWRAGNLRGLRTAGAGLVVLGLGLAAFVALNDDWMKELRFLTPVWPLLSAAVVLGAAELARSVRQRALRVAVAGLAVTAFAVDLPNRIDRTQSFADRPNVPVCYVAERFGAHFDRAAALLGLDPAVTTLLVPDVGGTLLTSHLDVIDMAGLADREIARLLRTREPRRVADHVFTTLRPTFVHLHPPWSLNAGLADDPRLRREYVALVTDRDWVRRDALDPRMLPELPAIKEELRRMAAAADTRRATAPREGCQDLLFSR